MTKGIPSNIELWRMSGIMQVVPIFSMALSCQTQVFEVYDSLPQPSLKTMDKVVSSAIDLCTFIYMGVGIAGYLAFADTQFTGNILVSFEPSFVTFAMKAGFLLSIVLSFPLCVLPCRTSLHSLIFGRAAALQSELQASSNPQQTPSPQSGMGITDGRFQSITLAIVVATLIIGDDFVILFTFSFCCFIVSDDWVQDFFHRCNVLGTCNSEMCHRRKTVIPGAVK